MLKIKINGYVIQIDIYEIGLKNWLKIADYILKEYSFDEWLKITYDVIKGDPFYEDEYVDNY